MLKAANISVSLHIVGVGNAIPAYEGKVNDVNIPIVVKT